MVVTNQTDEFLAAALRARSGRSDPSAGAYGAWRERRRRQTIRLYARSRAAISGYRQPSRWRQLAPADWPFTVARGSVRSVVADALSGLGWGTTVPAVGAAAVRFHHDPGAVKQFINLEFLAPNVVIDLALSACH